MIQITENINNWLKYGDRGVSSEAIVSHLTGINISGHWGLGHPHDPSDFNRCLKLVEMAPEIKEELHRMKEVSEVWSRLVNEWDDLASLMKKEAAENNGRCPKTYERMKEIIYPSPEAQS